MNIFQYQGQEEDHYTNILMNILDYNNCDLVKKFISSLLPDQSKYFLYEELILSTRTKYCPQYFKQYQFIIGIAPYKKAITDRNKYEANIGSIPDAWICGKNFNLLFEFKIRGTLDEAQISAHERLLERQCNVLRFSWPDIIEALKIIKRYGDTVQQYLIEQFLLVTPNFKSKRKSSGMPSQIISNINKEQEYHFIITGSKNINKPYVVESVLNGVRQLMNDRLAGIQEARRWIANYVYNNHNEIPINYNGMNTEISDYCVVPGRPVKKNQWNQWRLGGFIE